MSKSKYPDQIDTSVELPTVRDNITEIGSDALNSFKSAILALEKTLGVNPHGATGNTVASRLNRSLDSNGNLLDSAITQAGLLSGPISDNEVSESAAIAERKLDLNFPTDLLQDEISMLQSDISTFNATLAELSSKLSVHINPAALNRHAAVSISVSAALSIQNDLAILDLESGSLQDVFKDLYDRHINYSGVNISNTNNSHTAAQVYFDSTNIQAITTSASVQDAIEDIANISSVGLVDSILNLNSNGLIRSGSITDEYEGSDKASELISVSPITYTQAEGASRTTIVFTSMPTPVDAISSFDTLSLFGSSEESDNKSYKISEVSLSGGDLVSVEIFGGPSIDSVGGLTASIHKNIYRPYNSAGLLSTVRPRDSKTNTPDIQIANPNSATIISSQITPEALTLTAHTFSISIDGGTSIDIDTYDSNVSTQTIDSIINKINEQSIENRYNFMAYKHRSNNCYEIAIIHNIPNLASDSTNRTLSLSTGTSDDGTGILGFTDLLDITTEGTSGNSFLINGTINSLFGSIQSKTGADITLTLGTQGISLIAETFAESDIRVGDLLIVGGSSDSADDGTYRISSTLNSTAEVDGTYAFAGTLDEDSLCYITRACSPIEELTFTEIISANGSILFDTFIDEELDIFYSKRLEVDGEPRSGSFLAAIIDTSNNFIISGETGMFDIGTDGMASVTGPDGNPGEARYIASPGDYRLFASDGFSFITVRVGSSGLPSSSIALTLYGFDEIGAGSFILSRGVFSTSLGRVLGYPAESGIPSILDKRRTGTIDETIVSESFIEKYIEGPRNDLRGSGIIRGIEVLNVQLFSGYQTFDVSAGVGIVNGIRMEYPGKLDHRINTETDFYVALDAFGCIISGASVGNPDGYTIDNQSSLSPFYDSTVSHLASVEDQVAYDLRLFVDRNDLKFIKEIVISNQKHMGHFSSISNGVAYAKRFSDMFPDAGTPSIYIREGLFEISSPIIIDFDISIRGSGSSTVLTKSGSLATGAELISGNPSPLETIFYIGNTTSNQSDDILYGVSIKDMVYRTSDLLTNVGSFITIAEARNYETYTRLYNIENIIAEGPANFAYNGGVDADVLGEYFLVVGFADISTYTPSPDTYGSIILKNCLMKSMGIEYGPCHLRDAAGNIFGAVIASNNIGRTLSPNEGITNFEVFEVVSVATLSDFIEVANLTL